MKLKKTHIVLLIPVLIATIAGAVLVGRSTTGPELVITGIVETNEIDVASKIPGRIDSILVNEGDMVKKGQILARLESKEMDAKLEQARGVMNAAQSKMQMALNGARPEEKEAVLKLYQQAQHQYELAGKTWTRIQSLYNDQVISSQEKDQVEFQYKAAKEQMEAARAKYEMVMNGARSEEKTGAEALFYQAQNTYNEAMAYHRELFLVSPVDGEVSKKISDPGEIVASGYPLFTLFNPKDIWVVLQIREDQMVSFKKGRLLKGRVPALGNKYVDFRVSYIAPMAEFATWKATNQKGDFDLKTFEVHLRSASPVEDMRPGMTVNISVN